MGLVGSICQSKHFDSGDRLLSQPNHLYKKSSRDHLIITALEMRDLEAKQQVVLDFTVFGETD